MEQNELTLAIISSFVDKIFEKGEHLLSSISDTSKFIFKKGINDYLEKQRNRYSQIKTLLTNSPVDLYSIYYPLNLTTRNKSSIVSTSSVGNIFKKTQQVTIIGDAGSGKSTLIKHLFLNTIRTNFAIPILVELRYLNDYESDFTNYIIQKSLELQITENLNIFNEFLRHGKFIFFLDGYDELNTKRKQKIIEDISNFVSNYNKNYYILTSRPFSDIEQLDQFANYYMKDLSYEEDEEKSEINQFVKQVLQDEKELANKVNESISSNIATNKYIKEFLVNPLLLTLYILTYQRNTKVPDKKFVFYRRVIDVLFSEHDAKTKLGFQHEIKSGLNHEQMEIILRTFCILSFFNAQYDWDSEYMYKLFKTIKKKYSNIDFENDKLLYDLKVATALWLEDNGMYSFAHRSLQEFFAASFVKHLNQKTKPDIYNKIIKDLARASRRGGGYNNFLNLLNEMDTIDYYQYCYIPLLEELEKTIDNSNDENILKSFIVFFIKDYSINRKKRVFSINQNVYKTIYIHIKFTQKLYNILTENLNFSYFPPNYKATIKLIPIDENFFDIMLPELNTHISKLAKEYYCFIIEEKKKAKKYIKLSIDIDNEIIDMI